MYTHDLHPMQSEVLFDETLNNYVYKHVAYIYLTTPNGADGKPDFKKTKGQAGVVYLDPPDAANFIPYEQVTREKLKEWVANKIDIPALQNANLAEFDK